MRVLRLTERKKCDTIKEADFFGFFLRKDMKNMLKTLAACVREYKGKSIASSVFVALEVVMECLIPFFAALLITEIESGCGLTTIVSYGVALILMALLSLAFGTCSTDATIT